MDDKLYEQLSRAWIHFASWREKIFAGYLTVLAGLGFAFSKETTIPVRAAVIAFGLIVSAVFRIVDYRTTDLVDLCQVTGESLEDSSRGFFSDLNRGRFAVMGRSSYALAIDVLVAAVSGMSGAGLCICMLKWCHNTYPIRWWWSIVALGLGSVFAIALQSYSRWIWRTKRAVYNTSHALK